MFKITFESVKDLKNDLFGLFIIAKKEFFLTNEKKFCIMAIRKR